MSNPVKLPLTYEETETSHDFVASWRGKSWEVRLQSLWSADGEAAKRASEALYVQDAVYERADERESECVERFQQALKEATPLLPHTAEGRYQAAVDAAGRVLRSVREHPTRPFVEDTLAIALRPVRRLQAGALTPDVCATLYDYHRGVWTPHLTRPQLLKIHVALATTLAALPPDDMEAFWENLTGPHALMREAMQIGLEFLTSEHAVPHLLHGLERSTDSDTSIAIVHNLARIGNPAALPQLYLLRRVAALKDWPLARRISTTIKVLEHLNRGQAHRVLLRPASHPTDAPETLLRPTAETPSDPATLLRPSPNPPNE